MNIDGMVRRDAMTTEGALELGIVDGVVAVDELAMHWARWCVLG